jgi:hypothetical protein
MRAWLAIGIVSAALTTPLGCTSSERPAGSGMDVCFERRELEDWDEPELPPCSVESGSANGPIDYVYDYAYDERRRPIRSGVRGSHPEREIEYDDVEGTTTQVNYLMDGSMSSLRVERRDEHGNLLEERNDDLADGKDVFLVTHDYGCWAGRPAMLWPGPCSSRYDHESDGDPEQIVTFEWDERDRLVLRAHRHIQLDELLTESAEHADDGSWARWETDLESDGTIDQIAGAEYDEDGRVLRRWTDSDADGDEDIYEELEYDGEGRLVRELIVFRQTRNEELREWVYEERGRRVIETRSSSGPSRFRERYHRWLDRGGNVVAEASDSDEDGNADWCTYYSYACLFD